MMEITHVYLINLGKKLRRTQKPTNSSIRLSSRKIQARSFVSVEENPKILPHRRQMVMSSLYLSAVIHEISTLRNTFGCSV